MVIKDGEVLSTVGYNVLLFFSFHFPLHFFFVQETKESSSDLNILLEREKMYKQAIENADKAGEGSKARRYGRGLKVQYARIPYII